MTAQLERSMGRVEGKLDSLIDLVNKQGVRQDTQDKRIGKVERKQTWLSAVIGTVAALLGGSAEHLLKVALLVAALTALAPAALAQPAAAIDEPHRLALMKALRSIGVELGAVWPIGDTAYEVEEIRIERLRTGEVSITVRTKQVR